jgi:hypothetical protein
VLLVSDDGCLFGAVRGMCEKEVSLVGVGVVAPHSVMSALLHELLVVRAAMPRSLLPAICSPFASARTSCVVAETLSETTLDCHVCDIDLAVGHPPWLTSWAAPGPRPSARTTQAQKSQLVSEALN